MKDAKANRVDTVVYNFARAGDTLFAGSGSGLIRSTDQGSHWGAVPALHLTDVHFVAVQPMGGGDAAGATLLAANLTTLALSTDGGSSWNTLQLPAGLTEIDAVCVDGNKNLWVGGREGVWMSKDSGGTWEGLRTLFLTQVDSIYYDDHNKRILVTSSSSPMAFSVAMPDYKVSYADTGWKLRFVRPVGDHLVGATLFDGVVVQPEMVDSASMANSTGH